ncbi:MAG: acyl-CoA dehydrogenase family protein [Pseudomonadaceae bacterium]|nr:acyl-CoA dehydrogenase family protein [Pseudomonadaceae bacterium]
MSYFTDELRLIQQAAREFTNNEILPLANKLDPVQGVMPRSLIEKMGEMGYFGILIPPEKGGLGLGVMEYIVVAEELSRGWMSAGSIIARGNSFYRSIPGEGQEWEDKVARMAVGDYLGAFAMSEPNAGSDMAAVSTRAVRDGDDWVLTGNKYWCTFADEADFISVVCRIDTDSTERRAGLKTIAVEKPRGEFPKGVTGSPIAKIGYHGWKTWELHFDNVRTPAVEPPDENDGKRNLSWGGGFVGIQQGLEVARAHTAARSIGAAQGALDVAVEYAAEREQFGQAIAKFQAIRFKIANMATEIEAARQLTYFVCSEIDAGRRCDKEAAMAKYYASEMAERVTSEALQILGGAGYTTDYPVERYWRDARLTKIFEGTSEIMQKIISDRMLGR